MSNDRFIAVADDAVLDSDAMNVLDSGSQLESGDDSIEHVPAGDVMAAYVRDLLIRGTRSAAMSF